MVLLSNVRASPPKTLKYNGGTKGEIIDPTFKFEPRVFEREFYLTNTKDVQPQPIIIPLSDGNLITFISY